MDKQGRIVAICLRAGKPVEIGGKGQAAAVKLRNAGSQEDLRSLPKLPPALNGILKNSWSQMHKY